MINVKRNLSEDGTFYNHGELEEEGRGDRGSRLILRLERCTSPGAVYTSRAAQKYRGLFLFAVRRLYVI